MDRTEIVAYFPCSTSSERRKSLETSGAQYISCREQFYFCYVILQTIYLLARFPEQIKSTKAKTKDSTDKRMIRGKYMSEVKRRQRNIWKEMLAEILLKFKRQTVSSSAFNAIFYFKNSWKGNFSVTNKLQLHKLY